MDSLAWDMLELNQRAATELACEHEVRIVAGAGHLFGEPGALERVTDHACEWFLRHLPRLRTTTRPGDLR
jgi:putative phosphoribosyl transferase